MIISKLVNLKALHLHGCPNITDIGLAHLKPLRKLRILGLGRYIETTGITDVGLKALSGFENLESLTIRNYPKITDDGLLHISNLRKLKSLKLNGLNISGEGFLYLSKLPYLYGLDLSEGLKITDEYLSHLADIPRLSLLDLQGCTEITDFGIEQLSSAKNLLALGVKDCDYITDESVSILQDMGVNVDTDGGVVYPYYIEI